MRIPVAMLIALLAAGCGDRNSADASPPHAAASEAPGADGANAPIAPPNPVEARGWELQSSGEGNSLVLSNGAGTTELRLFCPGAGRWLVNAPAFEPIGSEERFSFGHASQLATLVADVSGDVARGGVTGEGPLPAGFEQLLAAPLSASYGTQRSGPHAPPPGELVQEFMRACRDGVAEAGDSKPVVGVARPPEAAPDTSAGIGACRIQEGRVIAANALRAVGTEPFWGAQVDGRCITYSHPDDQAGTRVWTTFSGDTESGVWTGALNGQAFVMRTSARAGCSDGMSDTRYPIAVALTVGGEQRSGCAGPR